MDKAIKVASTYLVIGYCWILLSDVIFAVNMQEVTNDEVLLVNVLKGFLFITVTAILLYYLIRHFYQAIEHNAHQYQLLFRRNPNPMFLYHPKTLQILEVNKRVTEEYGLTTETLSGKTVLDLHPQEDREEVRKMIESKRNLSFSKDNLCRHLDKKGKPFWVKIYRTTITLKEEELYLATAINVHEQESNKLKMEELNQKLQKRRAYLSSIVHSQTTFLVRFAADGKLLFTNKAFHKSLKRANQSKQQMPNFWDFCKNKNNTQKVKTLLQHIIDQKGTQTHFFKLEAQQGNNACISEWEVVALYSKSGHFQCFQAVGRDVTEQEATLRKNLEYQNHLEHIHNTVNDIIWTSWADSDELLYMNTAVEKITGYPQKAFINKELTWRDIIYPDDVTDFIEQFGHLSKKVTKDKAANQQITYRIVDKWGNIHHLLDKTKLVYDKTYGRYQYFGVSSDITDLKASQLKVAEFSEKLAGILANIGDGFFSINRAWEFTYVNKRFEELFNASKEELEGKLVQEVLPEAFPPTQIPAIEKAYQLQKRLTFEEYFPKQQKWFRVSFHPAIENASFYYQDITQEMQLELWSRTQNKNRDALINNTQDLIWSIDRKRNLIAANDAFRLYFQNLHGIYVEEGMGMIEMLKDKTKREKWTVFLDRGFKGESFRAEISQVFPDRGKAYGELRINPIMGANGAVEGLACLLHDITQRKLHEQYITSQNKKLKEIAAIQSHEIRRPVASILGLMELFDMAKTENEKQTIIEKLKICVEELDEVIHKVVYLSYK